MSNEINRPSGGYTQYDPFDSKPALPVLPSLDGLNTKEAAARISTYLAEVADTSIRTTYTTADTLDSAAESGAKIAGHMAVDVMGQNPIHINRSYAGFDQPMNPATLDVDFDATTAKIKGVVDSLQTSWLTKYFPAALPDGIDPLLEQVTSGVIVTEAQQEIMWERAKGQTLRDASRYEAEVVRNWASRGFSMPGGVVNAQIQRKNQDLFFANADLAAQQAIKALDIQVDSVKFAAEIATKLRLGLIDGLTGLVSAYLRVPSTATDYATGISNAKRASYSALNEDYRVLIDNGNLAVQSDQLEGEMHQRYLATALGFMGQYLGGQVQAAASATDSYARIAAATLAGVNSVTSIGIESIS
jgi:hypothetical protein